MHMSPLILLSVFFRPTLNPPKIAYVTTTSIKTNHGGLPAPFYDSEDSTRILKGRS